MNTHVWSCHSVFVRSYAGSSESRAKEEEGEESTAVRELKPLDLPGGLAGFTGNVLYPDEQSDVWNTDGEGDACRSVEWNGNLVCFTHMYTLTHACTHTHACTLRACPWEDC